MQAIIKGFYNKEAGNTGYILAAVYKSIQDLTLRIVEVERQLNHKRDNPSYEGSAETWKRESPMKADARLLCNLRSDLSELEKFKNIYMLSDQVKLAPEEVNFICKYVKIKC